ncbi:ATP-binding protein [Pedobacter sp. MC2016-24]|uniref:ATP-binding protein n=1 Tax=Pedobacter sp. MC2016-24 TaxID=2780090 RepID=UPI0018811FAB|nr:ATP-binding protein [Pedobacter sp. MC2016-24]MBE9601849.1 response regulator [Pedobacter sp. MC2016-24]
MFDFLSKRYNAILKLEEGLLNKARITILIQLLTAFSVLSIILFGVYYFQERNILLFRISLLMVMFMAGLVMIFVHVPWRMVGHYFIFCLTVFIWSNLLILIEGINIVTVQYVFMIVSGGYYILGLRWGLIYSLINTLPIVFLFSLQQFYGVDISIMHQAINIYAYNFSIVVNFLLLIFIHFYFFRAFKKTSRKMQKLTSNLKRSLTTARKTAEDKTNFLSTMSHELRTPLNAVIGMTNVLLDGDPRPDQKENLEILHFSAENLMATINDILSFNRLDVGMEKLELTTFRLDTLLSNVYGALKLRASAKAIKFDLVIDDSIKEINVHGDQSRLTQILFNLVGNAIKFTREGFVKVRASLKEAEKNSFVVQFEVADSGIGIPESQITKVFEPYYRASHRTNRQYHGTGLGLSIARRLVELHGGRLDIDSKEGVGTTFNFEISFTRMEATGNEFLNETLNDKVDIAGLRILFAEDDLINVMVLQKTLSRWGLKADVAGNGQLAIDAVLANDYDVVFMDINMPVMDGFEASRLIREIDNEQKSGIYIIALTASIGISIEMNPDFQYLDDFLFKPFRPEELQNKLEYVATLKHK